MKLQAKRKNMESAFNNGAALASSVLVLESEYLATQQKLEEINSNLNTWYKTLSIITNKQRIRMLCLPIQSKKSCF